MVLRRADVVGSSFERSYEALFVGEGSIGFVLDVEVDVGELPVDRVGFVWLDKDVHKGGCRQKKGF